jgi:DnaJ-domain-containing protein 1
VDSFFSRFERVLRGMGGRPLADQDPDDVLRQARAQAKARAQTAGARPRRPQPAPGGGLPPEVARAYANLELTPPASLDEAKTAWRALMRKFHPDKHQTDPGKTEIATKIAARLTEAYAVVREHLGDS